MSKYVWGARGQLEDAIAAATMSTEAVQQIPSLATYSLSARRDAALAEVLASFSEQAIETGVFTGVNPPNPLTIYSQTSTSLSIDSTVVATATVAGGLTLNPSITPTGSAIVGEVLTALKRSSAASGTHVAVVGYAEQAVATTGSAMGMNAVGVASHTTGTVAALFGLLASADHVAAGTVTIARAIIGTLNNTGGGTVTTGVVVDVGSVSGAYGTLYGLRIGNITAGSTNYAIYTNAGPVRFGDTVTVVGTLTAPGVERTLFLDSNKSSTSVAEASITSYVLPGGTLAANGHSLQIWVTGYCSAAVNFAIKFGSTYIAPLQNYVGGVFRVQAMLTRTGTATQEAAFSGSDGGGWVATAHTSPTETLSGNVTIDFRGNKDTSTNITLATVVVSLLTGP